MPLFFTVLKPLPKIYLKEKINIMAKYRRSLKRLLIDKSGNYNAEGCNTYSIHNNGNTIVVIDGVLDLLPFDQWEGPNENPEIIDFSDIDITFKNEVYNPGGQSTVPIDKRVIITKTFVSPL